MDTLPIELRQSILLQLSDASISGLKSLRLTSKTWAALGLEYLIRSTFTTLLNYPDFQRLLAVSAQPLFTRRIEALFINLGEINEYHARHNSYFIQYMRDPDDRLAEQEKAWGAYARMRGEKEFFIGQACKEELIGPALRNLTRLQKVDVSLTTCPFPEDDERMELLRQIWNIPSTRLLPRVATTERFTNLLVAILGSPSTITHLSHDRLPFEFFAQKAMTISLISTVFLPLTSLSITLDYSDMPNNLHTPQAFQNLSHCLRSAVRLKELSLSIQGRKKIDISSFLQSFQLNVNDPRGSTFKYLHELKLQGVSCTENELVSFVLVHGETLDTVQLGGLGCKAPHQKANGGIYLKEGTWKSVFKKIQAGCELEGGLWVQGDLVEMGDGGRVDLEVLERVDVLGGLRNGAWRGMVISEEV